MPAKRFVDDYLRGLAYLTQSLVGVIRDPGSRPEERELARDKLRLVTRELEMVDDLVEATSADDPILSGRLRKIHWFLDVRLGGSGEERRRRPRVSANETIEIDCPDGNRHLATLDNVSLCGMRVTAVCTAPLREGMMLALHCPFYNPCTGQERVMQITARLISKRPAPDPDGDSEKRQILGIEFEDLKGDELFFLEEYIECRLGMEQAEAV